MENELVKQVKKDCKTLYNDIQEKFGLLKSEGASEEILNELRSDAQRCIDIYLSVDKENVDEKNEELTLLQREVEFKYSGEFEEEEEEELEDPEDIEDEDEEEKDQDEETEEETKEETEEEEETVEGKKKSGVARGIATALGVVSLAGIATHTGIILSRKNNNAKDVNTETIEESENDKLVVIESENKEETATNETTTSNEVVEENTLVLGEYGTFFDITDDEQVQARAQYIYDNYATEIIDSLTENEKTSITVENIANTIRIMNGELPKDKDGNIDFEGSSLNDYTNILVTLTVNSGSNDKQEFSHFPAYLLTTDGSEVSEFIKSYDVIYEKLVAGLNTNDDEEIQDAIACLGYKYWNEWYLQGMYGDTNPHMFDTDLKYLTFIATIEPFNTTAKEWHLSEKKPVCIRTCLDYNTQEEQLLPVNNIHSALETGAWNNIGSKLAGIEVPNTPWLAEYYQALNEALNWKYDHTAKLTLK